MKQRFRSIAPALLTGALLAGCAATPQILPVTPQIETRGLSARGAGRSLAIEVVDARGTDVVGQRDPTRADSVITTAPEMLARLRTTSKSAYRDLGFTIVPVGQEADIALEVRLTDLGYRRAEGGVIRELRTGATVEATSVMREKTVSAIYRDGQGKDTVLPPTLAANAEILNRHLDAALSKLVADPRLTTE